MMLNLHGLGTVAIADSTAEYIRQLALGMPNPNWHRDWLLTLDLDRQSVEWFAANPSFANPQVWREAGILDRWSGSAAEAYRSGTVGKSAVLPARSEEGRDVADLRYRYTASLSFRNTTTGNTNLLRVGDSWTLEVSGPPNSDVLSVGGPAGQRNRTVLGQTSASGYWNTSGRMSSAEIGTWVQDFSVGGVTAGQLAFIVEAVPVTPPPATRSVPEQLADRAEEEAAAAPTWMEQLTSNPLLLIGGGVALVLLLGRGR